MRWMSVWRRGAWLAGATVVLVAGASRRPAAQAPLVLDLREYATAPMTGAPDGQGNAGALARITTMKEEPGGAARFFVVDLNGPIYILDKRTKRFTTYLDFNGSEGHRGLFARFTTVSGLANGLNAFAFDPDYRRNGRFYTVHIEDADSDAARVPRATGMPGLNLAGYAVTTAVRTPGVVTREAVVVEWTDTNVADDAFEGSARELLRVELNVFMHPMGELLFNPTARPGDADWRVLYIGCGDSGSGEQHDERRLNPQRLDNLVGKILRIIPDLALQPSTSRVSDNGRYRVPSDNPFVGTPGARPEIWAYGFRNPHRLTWGGGPASADNTRLIASSVGLHTWESVYLVARGVNYGYSAREGNEALLEDNRTGPRPPDDRIPVRVTDTVSVGDVVPQYPVIQYPHTDAGGDAIGGGFVYRGRRLPSLSGKFVFVDITTGRIWYADYGEMLAADDGKPETLAAFHELRVRWTSGTGVQVSSTMTPLVLEAYLARGGQDQNLPGAATVSGGGRADIRLAEDDAGELFVLSKSDGVIREVVGVGVSR